METILKPYFELTLYAPSNFETYFFEIKEYAKQNFFGRNIFSFDQNCFLFAVDIADKKAFLEQLEKQIIKYILTCKKTEFLSENISSIEKLGSLKNIFLKVLSMFDEEQDILEIQKNLRLTPIFYLDAFVLFRLKNLKKRWQELCFLTNDNSFFFDTGDLVFELLRFMLSNIKHKDEFLRLECSDDKITLLNKNNQLIFSQSSADYEKDFGNSVALKILDIMPKRIYLSTNFPNVKSTENLLLIFKNNLKVLDYA